jgi:pilus assembly protein Flp/PilA
MRPFSDSCFQPHTVSGMPAEKPVQFAISRRPPVRGRHNFIIAQKIIPYGKLASRQLRNFHAPYSDSQWRGNGGNLSAGRPRQGFFIDSTWEYNMNSLIAAAKGFARDENGITAIEYGLIAATMVAAVVTAFGFLTPALGTAFQAIATRLTTP